MAVRFTAASSQYWIRDTGTVLDHSAPYTWMTWLQLVTLPSGTDPTFLRLDRAGVGNTTEMLRIMNSTNVLRADVDGGGGSTNISGSALSANTWYHLAIVRTSTTNLFVYLNGVLDITNTHDVSTRLASNRMWAGTRDAGADFMNGSLHGMKAWAAALTQDEVLAEMYSIQPKRWDNLFEYWPIFEGGASERVTGYANAYNWTEIASPTDHTQDSGITWGGQSLFYPLLSEPPQSARPTSTITAGTWTDQSGGTTDMHSPLADESDATYIQSEFAPNGSYVEVLLGPLGDPGVNTGHVFPYRYDKSPAVSAGMNLTVQLRQGTSTVIASATHTNISGAIVDGEVTLSGAEADAITNWSDLRLRFTGTQV